MPVSVQIIVTLLLLAAVAASPWLWSVSQLLSIAIILLASGWGIYLVVAYLQWARRLSKPDAPPGQDSTSSQ